MVEKKNDYLRSLCFWLAKIYKARDHQFIGYHCLRFDKATDIEKCKKCTYKEGKE